MLHALHLAIAIQVDLSLYVGKMAILISIHVQQAVSLWTTVLWYVTIKCSFVGAFLFMLVLASDTVATYMHVDTQCSSHT